MDIFTALADPTRRQIVEMLALGDASFGALADQFEMSRPAVSQHLKALKHAGIVESRADAQRRIYRLSDGGLDEVDAWLDQLEVLLVEEEGDSQ